MNRASPTQRLANNQLAPESQNLIRIWTLDANQVTFNWSCIRCPLAFGEAGALGGVAELKVRPK